MQKKPNFLNVTLVGQLINVVVSKPEFSLQITEAYFVLVPCLVEVDGSVQSSLNDRPTCQENLKNTFSCKAPSYLFSQVAYISLVTILAELTLYDQFNMFELGENPN